MPATSAFDRSLKGPDRGMASCSIRPAMLASLLALLASLSWGTADFWAGLESRKTTAWTAALIGQGVAALALVATLLILGPDTPPPAALAPAVAGGVMGAAGALLQYRALALLDM